MSQRELAKRAREQKAAVAAAQVDDDIIDAEIIEDTAVEIPAPKAIEAPKLASVPDIPRNPIEDWEDPTPPPPVQAVSAERARDQLVELLDHLSNLDAPSLAAVATADETSIIVRFAYAFTAMGSVKPKAAKKPAAVKATRTPPMAKPAPDKLASGVGTKRRRNGDPVDPKDCKHPVNLRLGTMCSACGGTVK